MRIPSAFPNAKTRAGWTLVEMIFAIGISGLVLAAVATMTLYSARSFFAMSDYYNLNEKSRLAFDIMSRDIRQAARLTSYSTDRLVFADAVGATFSYTYDPDAGTLTRVYGGMSTVLLSNIVPGRFSFGIYQRNPSNDFTFYPANGVAANARLINVSWRCALAIPGSIITNTESAQTAKIVMRNEPVLTP